MKDSREENRARAELGERPSRTGGLWCAVIDVVLVTIISLVIVTLIVRVLEFGKSLGV